MVQVQLEVRAGAARFRVSARARSIRRAVGLAGDRYPGGEVKLILPVEPETFFDPREGDHLGVEMPEKVAV